MKAHRACLAILLLALSGCWTGGPFYQPSEAVQPLAAGVYLASGIDPVSHAAEEGPMRIEVGADGLTRFLDPDQAEADNPMLIAGFAPLGDGPDRFVMWITRWDDRELSGERTGYGTLTRETDGAWHLRIPGCAGTMIAMAQGAVMDRTEEGIAVCRFASRDQLVAALRRFLAAPPDNSYSLTLRPRG